MQEQQKTRELRNQVRIWIALLLGFLLVMWLLRGILMPFLLGLMLAYILDPAADFLERLRVPRILGSLVIIACTVAIIATVLVLLVPLLIGQIIGLLERLPAYLEQLQTFAATLVPELRARFGDERLAELESSIGGLLNSGIALAGDVTTQVAQSGLSMINALGFLVITPVVAFYLLVDWDRMLASVDALLPRAHRDEIREVFADIDKAMSGFIRGQSALVLALTIYYCVSLSLIGLNFGLAIGLVSGLMSFVPLVGFLTGFLLSMGVAIVQYWPDWSGIFLVVVVYIVGQFLEGNVLGPNLVGSSIGVHAVWLMFAIFAFGLLFGLIGVFLAVPLAAITGVLVRYAVRKYLQSSLYRSDGPDGAT